MEAAVWTPELWLPGKGWIPKARNMLPKRGNVFVTPRELAKAKEDYVREAVTVRGSGSTVNTANSTTLSMTLSGTPANDATTFLMLWVTIGVGGLISPFTVTSNLATWAEQINRRTGTFTSSLYVATTQGNGSTMTVTSSTSGIMSGFVAEFNTTVVSNFPSTNQGTEFSSQTGPFAVSGTTSTVHSLCLGMDVVNLGTFSGSAPSGYTTIVRTDSALGLAISAGWFESNVSGDTVTYPENVTVAQIGVANNEVIDLPIVASSRWRRPRQPNAAVMNAGYR